MCFNSAIQKIGLKGMSKNLDSTILTGFHQGDERAFRQLFDHFYPALYNFTQKLTGDPDEAKDIVSHTFQKLFQRHNLFETDANIKAFLYITARNNSLNYLHAQKTKNNRQREYAREMSDDTLLQYDYEIMDRLVDKVNAAIENLPEECCKIFKLLYYKQMKPAEIAALLQISINTVYVQKNRAIRALRLVLVDDLMAIAWLLCAFAYS